jgi:thiamine biosynthesis lipoprotein
MASNSSMKIDCPRPTRFPKSEASSAPVVFLLALAVSFPLLGVTTAVAEDHELTLYAFEQPHMGTLFRIKLYAESKQDAQIAATAAFNRINDLNQKLSDYLPQSELNQLIENPLNSPVPVSPDLRKILSQSIDLAEKTEGAFDPTVGYYTNLWRRAVRKQKLPTPDQLADARKNTGYKLLEIITDNRPRITRDQSGKVTELEELAFFVVLKTDGLFLDLGGIAKGYAADEALKILQNHNITRAAVAAGGDIRVGDPPPDSPHGWEIPILGMNRDEESITATIHLKNAAISTSGDREQFVDIDGIQYSHIVDPRTGLGLTHRITATVIAPTATQSDSLATTLCILGPGILKLDPDVHSLVITRDDQGHDHSHRSPGFPTIPSP